MSNLICRWLTVFALFCTSVSCFAGSFWFYSERIPVSHPAFKEGDRQWLLKSFEVDPYLHEMEELRQMRGFERTTILFARAAAPALANEYLKLARTWKDAGIQTEFKFVGTLPTEPELEILKPLCQLGVKLYFISSSLPLEIEAANLNALRDACTTDRIQLDIGMNRYFRHEDIDLLDLIPQIPMSVTNNYFPTAFHVDVFNRIENPVNLNVFGMLPAADQVEQMLKIKRMQSLALDLDLYPDAEQYSVLEKLSPAKDVSVRWMLRHPRQLDVDAWAKLKAKKVVVPMTALEDEKITNALRALQSEVIVTIQQP